MAHHTDDLPLTDNVAAACSTSGCPMCQCGALKRVIYVIMAVTLGGMASLAMYPELADYAYPLMGKPSQTGFTGEHPCPADRACPAGSSHSNFPLLGSPEVNELRSYSIENDYSKTDLTGLNCCEEAPSSKSFSAEVPADAISAVESSAQGRSN